MGCFNVSCGISSISMYAEKAALFPLVPNSFFSERAKVNRGAFLVSNDMNKMHYVPLTLPIFGRLNTYGVLEEITKDANTAAIEKFFNVEIEDFAEAVAVGKNIPKNKAGIEFSSSVLSGMYVHKKIYDGFTKTYIGEFGRRESSIWNTGYITPFVLRLMGFKFVKEDDNRKRYTSLYRHPDFNIDVWSDETWVEIDGNSNIYHVKEFIEYVEKKTKKQFPDDMKARLKKTSIFSVEVEEAYENYRAFLADKEVITDKMPRCGSKIDQSLKEYLYFNNPRNQLSLWPYHHNQDGMNLFVSLYEDLEAIKESFIDFKCFDLNMVAVNRIYTPSWNGYQHGNHYASIRMLENALKITKDILDE